MYVTHPTIIENKDLVIEEDIYEKNVNISYSAQWENVSGPTTIGSPADPHVIPCYRATDLNSRVSQGGYAESTRSLGRQSI